jgi:hypothetical protein
LVELSIVLVIIGLLASGVMVGQDMIRAAELRSVTTEKDQIQTAVNIFESKYDAIPGDMNNATAFWGVMPTGTCNNSAAGASGSNGTQTCNGNGDKNITRAIPVANSNSEMVLFWQHLNNAGLIKGQFFGVFTGAWEDAENCYASKLCGNCVWHPNNINVTVSDTIDFEGNFGNTLIIANTSSHSTSSYPALTPTEAYNIDKKIDDGTAGLGEVVTREFNGVNCNSVAASNSVAIAESAIYNLAYKDIACQLQFKNMW